jgi:Ca2+-binding EF-hand superfamily protein
MCAPKSRLKTLRLAIVTVVCFALPPAAIADSTTDIRSAYDDYVSTQGGSQNVFQNFARVFERFDVEGKGLSLKEIERVERVMTARTRAQLAMQYLIFDLNGDLVVTREEMTEAILVQLGTERRHMSASEFNNRISKNVMRQVERLLTVDKNANGSIEGSEFFMTQRDVQSDGQSERTGTELARALIAADPNKDGLVTQAEAAALISAAIQNK